MEFFEELKKSNKQQTSFYCVQGHDADINLFYDKLSDLITNSEASILLCEQDFILTDNDLVAFNNIWKLKADCFLKDDYNITNKSSLKDFLRNFIYMFSISSTNLTLEDIENSLLQTVYMFVKIHYKSYFMQKGKPAFISKFKGFIFKIINWFNTIIYKNIKNTDLIIYYDTIKTEEFLFFYFLYMLKLNILIVDTLALLNIRESYLKEIPVQVIKYEYKSAKKLLDLNKNKIESISVLASREIGNSIFNQDTQIFKPRQLITYNINPILLYVIYDELHEVLKTEIRYREGFKIKRDTIKSPQLFIKIDGVGKNTLSENISEFGAFYNQESHIINLLDQDKENIKCLQHKNISIDNLAVDYDSNLVKKIKDAYSKLTNHENDFFIRELNKDRKFINIIDSTIKFLISNKQYMFALKKTDMPFLNQKVILFDYTGTVLEDKWIISIQCSFFYLMGFDVLILSPVCNTVIETTLQENIYQKIILPNVYSEYDTKKLLVGLRNNKKSNKTFIGSTLDKLKNILKDK